MEANVADEIRAYAAREYVQAARRRGLDRVEITAGDVGRALKLRNLTPSVCGALRSKIFLQQNQLEIEKESGPPSGMGTRTTITYRLLDKPDERSGSKQTVDFVKLRGLLKDALASLGGGENFLRREREHFYGPGRGDEK